MVTEYPLQFGVVAHGISVLVRSPVPIIVVSRDMNVAGTD